MAKKKEKEWNHTEIMEHDIRWWVNSPAVKELDPMSHSHIFNSIQSGFTSGELHVEYGRHDNLITSGWWEIIDWKTIALKLYTQLEAIINADHTKAREATYEFDMIWECFNNSTDK